VTRIHRSEDGQALVTAVVFLSVLLGMTACVLDVGSWFRAQRAAQATADAAALAGAQALPDDPTAAQALAASYARKNGGAPPTSIQLSRTVNINDTIAIRVTRTAPAFFARALGIGSAQVGARATARAFLPGEAKYVAPIVVNIKHPKLSAGNCPCYGPTNATTLTLGKTGAPGSFTLLNLNEDQNNGTVGTSELGDWILNGFDEYLPLGRYYSDPGAAFNSSNIQAPLTARIGTELLFPVYDVLSGNGSNARYRIIAWAAFHLTGLKNISGTTGTLEGWFTRTIWTGLEVSSKGKPAPDFGVRSVTLTQ
jgi:Flp pilus assembly protein TadG